MPFNADRHFMLVINRFYHSANQLVHDSNQYLKLDKGYQLEYYKTPQQKYDIFAFPTAQKYRENVSIIRNIRLNQN